MKEKVIKQAKELAQKYIEAGKPNTQAEASKLLVHFPGLDESLKKDFIASFVFPDDLEFCEIYKQNGHSVKKMAKLFGCELNVVTSKVFIVNMSYTKEKNKPVEPEQSEKTSRVVDESVDKSILVPPKNLEEDLEAEDDIAKTLNSQRILLDNYMKANFEKDETIKTLEEEKKVLLEENLTLGCKVDELKEIIAIQKRKTQELEEFVSKIYAVFQDNLAKFKEVGLDNNSDKGQNKK